MNKFISIILFTGLISCNNPYQIEHIVQQQEIQQQEIQEEEIVGITLLPETLL